MCVPLWFLNRFHQKLSEYVWLWGSEKPTSRDSDHLRSDDAQTQKDRFHSLIASAHLEGWVEEFAAQKLLMYPIYGKT